MEITQIRLKRMATFCYIIADEASKECALIDPAFEFRRILEQVNTGGYRVTHVINTHCHSDHSAGNACIVFATGAGLLIHELDAMRLNKLLNRVFSRLLGGKGSPTPDVFLKDRDLIEIGETALRVIHTPGHTPGSICLHMEGHLFTGDTLFVGSVGRTDLAGGSMEQLMKSIRERVYSLPGETKIWPGHDYGLSPYSTIANELRTNPFVRPLSPIAVRLRNNTY